MAKKVSTSNKAQIENKSIEEVKDFYLNYPADLARDVCKALKVSEYDKKNGSKGHRAMMDAETILSLSEDQLKAVLIRCGSVRNVDAYIGAVFFSLANPVEKPKTSVKVDKKGNTIEQLKQGLADGVITQEEYTQRYREILGI